MSHDVLFLMLVDLSRPLVPAVSQSSVDCFPAQALSCSGFVHCMDDSAARLLEVASLRGHDCWVLREYCSYCGMGKLKREMLAGCITECPVVRFCLPSNIFQNNFYD